MARREKDLHKKWIGDVDRLRTIINTAITSILDCSTTTTSSESAQLRDKLKAIQITATEMEIHKALGKSNHLHILSLQSFESFGFVILSCWWFLSLFFFALSPLCSFLFNFLHATAFSEIHILAFFMIMKQRTRSSFYVFALARAI